jgi:DNA-binding HxlR family transcriptional regulator
MIAAAPSNQPMLSDATRLAMIEGRWTLQILLCLNGGELRFSDLRTAIPGISSNVLTDRIRVLLRAGLVERHYLPPPTARHLYALGPLADGLRPALDALASWRAAPASDKPRPQ